MHIEFVEAPAALARLKTLHLSIAPGADGASSVTVTGAPSSATIRYFAADDGRRAAVPAVDAGISVAAWQLPSIVEAALHKLHCPEAFAMPKSTWRNVTDVVAVALKNNRKWMAVDAALGVELNTADALVIHPSEHHLLRDLVQAMLLHGDSPSQGLVVCATSGLLAIDISPPGSVTFSVASESAADQIRALCCHLKQAID